jgi:hypothetical protein
MWAKLVWLMRPVPDELWSERRYAEERNWAVHDVQRVCCALERKPEGAEQRARMIPRRAKHRLGGRLDSQLRLYGGEASRARAARDVH